MRMRVSVTMPNGLPMTYVGVGQLTKSYGIYSLELTVPNGHTFTFNIDRIRWAWSA